LQIFKALVIALTSDFVPKMLYRTTLGYGTLIGYVNNSLSYADATGIRPEVPNSPFLNQTVPICR
jgi:hypothetical protein